MSTLIFVCLGILTFLFEVGMVFVLFITRHRFPEPYDLVAYSRLSMFFLISTLIGFGLIFLRRWAAVLLSIFTLAYGGWLFIATILYVEFPIGLVNIFTSFLFFLPMIVTIAFWSGLKPGGKWYF